MILCIGESLEVCFSPSFTFAVPCGRATVMVGVEMKQNDSDKFFVGA